MSKRAKKKGMVRFKNIIDPVKEVQLKNEYLHKVNRRRYIKKLAKKARQRQRRI